MNDRTIVIRSRRKGYKGRMGNHRFTRWHCPVDVPADDDLQTACGLRFKRANIEIGAAGDGELCRNCVKAMRTVPESVAA